jgi:hypothetical protein
MACLFEADTECCVACGVSLETYRAAGASCRGDGGRVVHLDRARARRHRRDVAALVRLIEAEAARLAAVRRRDEVDALCTLDESRDGRPR